MEKLMRRMALVGVLGLAAGVASCADSGTAPDEEGVVTIHLTSGLAFSPAQVTIAPGTTVRWVNDASVFHTITPDGHQEWERATMSSSGDTFEHTFASAGEFPYFCEPHRSQGMTGTITVDPNASTGGDDGGSDPDDGYGY